MDLVDLNLSTAPASWVIIVEILMDLVDLNSFPPSLAKGDVRRDPYGSRGSKSKAAAICNAVYFVEILVDLNHISKQVKLWDELVEILIDLN